MTIITCAKCGAKNRVDESRGSAKCGKCGAPLVAGVMTITDASFANDLVAAGASPILVDCWATWCPPCRAIAPIIDALANESAGKYRVGKLNVDENRTVATKFSIDSIPTLLIFKNGQLVDRLVGLQPKPAIQSSLMKWT